MMAMNCFEREEIEKRRQEIENQLSDSVYGIRDANKYLKRIAELSEKFPAPKLTTHAFADSVDPLRYLIPNIKFVSAIPFYTIKKVIFNGKATIVKWSDGTKTVVKLQGEEWYDPEKALAMAICKKALGNKGNYYEVFKQWLPAADTIAKENKKNRENFNSSDREEEDMTRTMKLNVLSLYREGKYTREIAEICNLSEAEVVYILEEAGAL